MPSPKKPAGKKSAPFQKSIGKAANYLADKLPNAQKDAQRRMRTRKPGGGAARG